MSKYFLEKIKNNNQIINEIIQKILLERREKNISIEEGESKKSFDPIAKAIFELEIRKCLETYKAEFPSYSCQGKEGVSFVDNDKKADCFGGLQGLQIAPGLQESIEKMIVPVMKKLGYCIKDGEVFFSRNLNENNINKPVENVVLNKNGKFDGSLKDQMDYFAFLLSKNGIDMDWVIDCLPHEAMHTFGTIGGNTFIKEGTTEQLTREICEKYGMHMAASSHTQETDFVRKLEAIVGRDNIIAAGMYNEHRLKKDDSLQTLSENNTGTSFEDLKEMFDLLKKYEDDLANVKNEADRKKIEEFQKKHAELMPKMKKILVEYNDENYVKRYDEMAKTFDSMIRIPNGSFFKLISKLDILYEFQTSKDHKLDPTFYRKLYTENLFKVLNESEIRKLLEISSEEHFDIEQVREEGFDFLGTGKKAKSYIDLISPIDEYIKSNNIVLEESKKESLAIVSNLDGIYSVQNEEIDSLIAIAKGMQIDIKEIEERRNGVKINSQTAGEQVNSKLSMEQIINNALSRGSCRRDIEESYRVEKDFLEISQETTVK